MEASKQMIFFQWLNRRYKKVSVGMALKKYNEWERSCKIKAKQNDR